MLTAKEIDANRDDDTVEQHAWYDQTLFPDTSPMPVPNPDGDE